MKLKLQHIVLIVAGIWCFGMLMMALEPHDVYITGTKPTPRPCPSPHFVWGMKPTKDEDLPPCVSIQRNTKHGNKPFFTFEREDGAVLSAYSYVVRFPDDWGYTRFVDWVEYNRMQQNYTNILMRIAAPYCPHGTVKYVTTNGVAANLTIHCSDGSDHDI